MITRLSHTTLVLVIALFTIYKAPAKFPHHLSGLPHLFKTRIPASQDEPSKNDSEREYKKLLVDAQHVNKDESESTKEVEVEVKVDAVTDNEKEDSESEELKKTYEYIARVRCENQKATKMLSDQIIDLMEEEDKLSKLYRLLEYVQTPSPLAMYGNSMLGQPFAGGQMDFFGMMMSMQMNMMNNPLLGLFGMGMGIDPMMMASLNPRSSQSTSGVPMQNTFSSQLAQAAPGLSPQDNFLGGKGAMTVINHYYGENPRNPAEMLDTVHSGRATAETMTLPDGSTVHGLNIPPAGLPTNLGSMPVMKQNPAFNVREEAQQNGTNVFGQAL